MALPLRRQIVLLNVAILVPVVVAVSWSGRATYREQKGHLHDEARAIASSVTAYLERGFDLDAVQTIIRAIPLPPGSVITVTDRNSVVLARSVDADQYVGQQVDERPMAPSAVPGFVERVGIDGIERVFANEVYAGGPWLVSVGIPTSVASERIQPVIRRNAAIALGVVGFTLALEFLLLGFYTRAFDRIIAVAGRVANGDFSRPDPIKMPSREMELLQTSFVHMLDRTREAHQAIAAQVAEERRIRKELESLQRQVIRQERLAAIGVLASGVAHELNNPLQAILGFSELLQMRTDLPDTARQELKVIQKESTRASAIIRNLSRFSRQQTPEPSRVWLREVVASVVELRQRKLEEAGIRLVVEEEGNPLVLAVFAELQQVALNFVINAEQALAACPEPRLITIHVSDANGCARLEVHDSGPGVPPEDEPKLFQPFFTTKPVGEGTGLGLSISYGIIQSHGGRIGYRRAAHGGASFYFELPLLARDSAA